jgi:hypothetical protein
MRENTQKFFIKGFWVVIVLFIIRCVISKPTSSYDCFGFAGEVISVALILMKIYEHWLWQYNPLEKIPNINGEYAGNIEYNYNGNSDKKETTITIKQSLFSTNVKITTNEITSNTITSSIVLENNEYVLYYTYITNPKNKYSKENPIQYGTCRIIVKSKTELQGIYWTTRQTIGDIYLKRRD